MDSAAKCKLSKGKVWCRLEIVNESYILQFRTYLEEHWVFRLIQMKSAAKYI